jgi:drug/metabolite transporter (DMT)-like permease
MHAASTERERRLAYLAWIAVCLIWGTTYLGIRVTLETMSPLLMSGLRWAIAGSLLAGYLALRGERLPPPSQWGSVALLGFLLLVLGNGGVAVAERWVPSGLTAVIVACSPFWMAGVESLRRDGEPFTRRIAAGLAIGFCGIVLLVWPELTSETAGAGGFVAGVIALQLACLGWSLGSSYSRRHARNENVFSTAAAQMIAGGVMMLALATADGEWGTLHMSVRSTTAFVYLTSVGAIGGFVAYTYALRHLPVSLVSLYAYINPIIAVALGVALLGEPFDARMAAAAAFVFTGVAIVQARKPRLTPPARQTLAAQSDSHTHAHRRAV